MITEIEIGVIVRCDDGQRHVATRNVSMIELGAGIVSSERNAFAILHDRLEELLVGIVTDALKNPS